MFIGAHVSVAKGLPAAVEYAVSVGCETVQIFVKSPRRWEGPPTDADTGRRFAEAREAAGIATAFTHTAYLINLASADDLLWERSVAALADEITRGRLLAADGVVTHLGTHPSGESDVAADRIALGIQRAFEQATGDETCATRLLLENTAGGGTSYGRSIGAIGAVLDRCTMLGPLLGMCLDTCHAHAAGIDLASDSAWRSVVAEVGRECGPGSIRLIHANDCMFERGSSRDRHAWIGEGTMGSESFSAMLRLSELAGVSIVTEMPGEVPQKDEENIRRLKALQGT